MANTYPQNPSRVNIIGTIPVKEIEPASQVKKGFILRQEPGGTTRSEAVVVHAYELMGRDIGRYVAFIERFGLKNESARLIVAELRQIYMTGHGAETVALTVGLGGETEYSLKGTDKVRVYGDQVGIDLILEEDRVIDNQDPKKK